MDRTGTWQRGEAGLPALLARLNAGELGRVVRFVLVGGVATLVHVSFALLALHAAGAAPHLANLCGFIVAVVFSYVMHSRVTFRHGGSGKGKGTGGSVLPRFALVASLGFVVSSGAVSGFLALGLAESLAVPLAALVVPVASYLANRFWVFR